MPGMVSSIEGRLPTGMGDAGVERANHGPDKAGGPTLRVLLREGTRLLSEAGVEHAGQEALWLAEYALRSTRLDLQLNGGKPLDARARRRLTGLFARRAKREPLQYILGTQAFCGLEFSVDASVLIPRPETELLVEAVARYARDRSDQPIDIVDVGTGSGCIAVALANALPTASLYAIDCSAAALRLAQRNAARHGVAGRVRFLEGDLLQPLRRLGLDGRLSVVVSNPPYILDGELAGLQPEVAAYEPRAALAGGPDGLTIIRRLLDEAAACLMPGGVLALEVGQGQAQRVCQTASASGLYEVARIIKDHADIERVVCLTRLAAV